MYPTISRTQKGSEVLDGIIEGGGGGGGIIDTSE